MTEMIEIAVIRRDGGTQSRAGTNQKTVQEYAEARRDGTTLPAITLYFDGQDYWLADGFHRVEAEILVGNPTIAADVLQGTRRDAVLHSVGANANHGLRRTNDDKRRAVETLLSDKEWAAWSDREIARRSGVTGPTVAAIRHELAAKSGDTFQHLRIGADGREYKIKQAVVQPPTPNADPKIELARQIVLTRIVSIHRDWGGWDFLHEGVKYRTGSAGNDLILNEGLPSQRVEKVGSKQIGVIIPDAEQGDMLYRFSAEQLKTWLDEQALLHHQPIEHELIGSQILVTNYHGIRRNTSGMFYAGTREHNNWAALGVVERIIQQPDGQHFALVRNSTRLEVYSLEDALAAPVIPQGLNYHSYQNVFSFAPKAVADLPEGDWFTRHRLLTERYPDFIIFYSSTGLYGLGFVAGNSVELLKAIMEQLPMQAEMTDGDQTVPIAWVDKNDILQGARANSFRVIETSAQYEEIQAITKSLIEGRDGQWQLKPELPASTTEPATTEPSSPLQVGDSVLTRTGRVGKIVSITGRHASVEAKGSTTTHELASLSLVGRATVVAPDAATYEIGDYVRVDGSRTIGRVVEMRADGDVKVTRPNPTSPTNNMTHWVRPDRLQKVPTPTTEPAEDFSDIEDVIDLIASFIGDVQSIDNDYPAADVLEEYDAQGLQQKMQLLRRFIDTAEAEYAALTQQEGNPA